MLATASLMVYMLAAAFYSLWIHICRFMYERRLGLDPYRVVLDVYGRPHLIAQLLGPPAVQEAAALSVFVILVGGVFAIGSYASHYLGKHPYLWTAVAVGSFGAFKEILMILGINVCNFDLRGWPYDVVDFFDVRQWPYDRYTLFSDLVVTLFLLAACLAGAWYGRKFRHKKFLAKKLARMERKASRGTAAQHEQQPSTTLDQTSPTDLPAANNTATTATPASGPDLLEQLKTLKALLDEGALTEEEFQAKKTEILARI